MVHPLTQANPHHSHAGWLSMLLLCERACLKQCVGNPFPDCSISLLCKISVPGRACGTPFEAAARAHRVLKALDVEAEDGRQAVQLKPGWAKGHARLGAAFLGMELWSEVPSQAVWLICLLFLVNFPVSVYTSDDGDHARLIALNALTILIFAEAQ